MEVHDEETPITDNDNFDYNAYNFEFSEKSIRLGFIRKVYGILLCQLLVTIIFITLFLYVVMTFIIIIVLACCPDVRRQWPVNFIMLALFTLFESILLGSVAACYESEEVLMAIGITAIVALALTLFAFQTKWDFTMCNGMLFVLVIVLLCFGLLAAIIRNYYLNMVYAALGALLFSMYIVFDTQMMLGGKHKYSLSPEEYIFAALNLYLDIINLFMFILSLIGGARQ